MRSTQVRTLLAGLVLATSAVVLTLTGGTLGVLTTWPVLLLAGVGLLVGVPRLRHALALTSGVLVGTLTAWTSAAMLPDVPAGRATATALGIVLLTAVTLASGGRLRLSVQLVAWAATLARTGPVVAAVPVASTPLVAALAGSAASLLVAAALGLLLAQVTQLVAGGVRGAPGRPGAPGGTAAVLTLVIAAALTPSVTPARADTPAGTDPGAARVAGGSGGLVTQHQTVIRTSSAGGAITGGSVVTRLVAEGTGGVTVVLRDQAVRGLRSLTGFAGPGPLRGRDAPEVVDTTVTHRLDDGTVVRTAAALDRDPPVRLDVAITLDGIATTAAEVVGRSGRLEVTYTVTNLTVEPRELRASDGAGRSRTVVRETAVPMVGELVVTLDDRFRDLRTVGAIAGDGRLVADLVLAGPVGAPVRTITWSATVEEAAVPPVHVRLTPVALAGTTRGGIDPELVRRSAAALRAATDTAGLALTGLAALGAVADVTPGAADVARVAKTAALLTQLVGEASERGAELSELRALIELQDARVRAGEGAVHGLLTAADVRPVVTAGPATARPQVEATVVYVLDVAGQGDVRVPGTALRLALALVLLLAVGLLGRAIDRVARGEAA